MRTRTVARGVVKAAAWVALMFMSPATALGQFFDDFNGNALAPHWEVLRPEYWQHSVSGGMLHVENLLTNHAVVIRTSFNPLAGDFVARARLGWDTPPTGGGRDMHFVVENLFGQLIGQFVYIEPVGAPARIQVQGGQSQPVLFPAPSPGMHDVTLERIGGEVHFSLDGFFLTALPTDVLPAGRTAFLFGAVFPPPNPFPNFHVDRVEVVPAPGPFAVLALGFTCLATRRRRS